ncbi:MAG: hypothetical protein K0S39_1799 [Paenibacillus sp.]|jgi:hypothetical protein|nr:hypothetical protein [Paenibacillus sp.]
MNNTDRAERPFFFGLSMNWPRVIDCFLVIGFTSRSSYLNAYALTALSYDYDFSI